MQRLERDEECVCWRDCHSLFLQEELPVQLPVLVLVPDRTRTRTFMVTLMLSRAEVLSLKVALHASNALFCW